MCHLNKVVIPFFLFPSNVFIFPVCVAVNSENIFTTFCISSLIIG